MEASRDDPGSICSAGELLPSEQLGARRELRDAKQRCSIADDRDRAGGQVHSPGVDRKGRHVREREVELLADAWGSTAGGLGPPADDRTNTLAPRFARISRLSPTCLPVLHGNEGVSCSVDHAAPRRLLSSSSSSVSKRIRALTAASTRGRNAEAGPFFD